MRDDLIRRRSAIDAICDNCDTVEASCPHYPCSRYVAVEDLPSAEPLTEEDYIELRDRFGEYVEFVVKDMISGKGERWIKTT